jgi:hypothetical protein
MKKVTTRDASALLKGFVAAFTNAGYFDLDGKSPSAVLDLVRQAVRSLPSDFDIVLDHRQDLLKLARHFRLQNRREYAVLMYATWIEHSLNLILQELARARSVGETHVQAFLREASVRAKSSWLFVLLGRKPLSNRIVSRIQRLADSRNSFIHYKWNRLSKQVQSDLDSTLSDAEPVVRDLQRVLRKTGLLSSRSQVVRHVITHRAKGATVRKK